MVARHGGMVPAGGLASASGDRRGDRLRRSHTACGRSCCRAISRLAFRATARRRVTVASRARPDFERPGAGPQFPAASGMGGNRRRQQRGRQQRQRAGTGSVGSHPSLLIGSDWSRNSLGAYVGVDDPLSGPAAAEPDQLDGLDRGHAGDRARPATVSVAHLAASGADRARCAAIGCAGRLSGGRYPHRLQDRAGPVVGDAECGVSAFRYDATTIRGVPASQAYRDRDVVQGAVTTRYELSPQRNLLLVTRALGVHYVDPQQGVPTRDSTGYQVLVGISDDDDAVWRYRVLLGWEVRAFQASRYSTHSAPMAEAALIWSPAG